MSKPQRITISPSQLEVLVLILDGPQYSFYPQTHSQNIALKSLIKRGWVQEDSTIVDMHSLSALGACAARLAREAYAQINEPELKAIAKRMLSKHEKNKGTK